jgi:hypothetical protein
MTNLNDAQFGRMSRDEFAQQPGTMWHGSPAGTQGLNVGSHSGLHVGSQEAARQALNARIGTPAQGDWDGTREYGQTHLVPGSRTGYGAQFHRNGWGEEPRLPEPGRAKYSDQTPVPLDAKPDIFPVRIVGPMTNTPHNPHEDFRANGLMAGQLKRGTAKRGYYYTNIGEDEGSISAVVPGRNHVATHEDFVSRAQEFNRAGEGR